MHRTRRRTLLAIGGLGYPGPARRDDAGGSGSSTGSGSTEGGSGSTGSNTGESTAGEGDNGTEGDSTAGKTPNIQGDFDKERYERSLAAARAAEAKAKADARAAKERTDAILKAAGLTPDGKQDPAEQLAAAKAAADKATETARERAVELAVYKRAPKNGGDPEALLDSLNFKKAVKDLDPDAADFDDKVVDAIKAAVKANPKLAATATQGGQGPARQGADITGSGGGSKARPTSLGAALNARMSA